MSVCTVQGDPFWSSDSVEWYGAWSVVVDCMDALSLVGFFWMGTVLLFFVDSVSGRCLIVCVDCLYMFL